LSLIYSINLFLQDKIRVLGDFFRISSVGLPNVGWKVDLNTVWTIFEPEADLAALKLVVTKLINDLPSD